ncbi:DUF6356 family protein [Sphingomonas hankyongi]|uniref:DUF6356 family protein n=1 Tax=Sphingomonas hankyongi TaxID=2908209 RepID=A0ABT0S105_9SPHN|nr:DUF6356 family protein [Sphingomonas hankyongi]MCL6729542.1 DUF6356 family protein [Sphingomonas hankyongi]
MPLNQTIESEPKGLVQRLFTEHPRSLGMSWAGHGLGAVKIGAELIGAGAACIVHAIVPGWFTQTAGKTVERMHDHMIKRRTGAANPEAWPDYEI